MGIHAFFRFFNWNFNIFNLLKTSNELFIGFKIFRNYVVLSPILKELFVFFNKNYIF